MQKPNKVLIYEDSDVILEEVTFGTYYKMTVYRETNKVINTDLPPIEHKTLPLWYERYKKINEIL
jgi:hypothetical protein